MTPNARLLCASRFSTPALTTAQRSAADGLLSTVPLSRESNTRRAGAVPGCGAVPDPQVGTKALTGGNPGALSRGPRRTLVACAVLLAASTLGMGSARAQIPLPSSVWQQPRWLPGDYPRLLPLGDSITVGTGAPCGYRAALQLALAGLGQPYVFVGSQDLNWALHGFEGLLSPYHEGHGGYTISQLIDGATAPGSPATTIESWLSAAQPDVVLLHAGTNDMFDPLRWQDADRQLERLLMRMESHQPGLRTLVAQILPTGLDEFNLCLEAFNRDLVEVLRRRQLEGQVLGVVDMYNPLAPFHSGDGSAVHPDGAQYIQMAEVWLKALVAPQTASLLPLPEAAHLPLTADAFSEQRSHPSALLSDGSGMSGEVLRSEVSNGDSYAWVSAPFSVEWSSPYALVPSESEQVWLQFDLAAPAQVDSVWLWAGRGEELLLPDGQPDFRIRDNPKVLAVETLQADGNWISRGMWTLRRPPRTRWHPGERFAVNWSGVRALRLKVLEMDTANLSPGLPPGFAQVALGEVRLRGTLLR